MSTRSWFDSDKLFDDERLVRSAPARVRTAAPPHWWEGELILTSDRLFFLPAVDDPLLDDVAFWLLDLKDWRAANRNRLIVAASDAEHEFQLVAGDPVAMIAGSAPRWARDLTDMRAAARRRRPLDRRRAAG
jgi:hypothetical protein